VVPAAGWLYGSALVAYGLTLGFMAVLATGLGATATVGGIVFIISDMSIAVTSFVYPGRLEHAELLIMSTYLVAQLLLVLGVIDAPDPPTRSTWSATLETTSVKRSAVQPSP
jgi:YhhN family